MDEGSVDALFARYVEHLVVEGVRLSVHDLAREDPELIAALAERIEAFLKLDQALGQPSRPLVGRALAHYRVLEKIGVGGMSEVYRALDTRLGREVALKVLPPLLALASDRRARFEREARLLATVEHPGIEAIYGIEHADDTAFLVLELVNGETLAERVAREPLPVQEALRVFEEIAAALEAAHSKGVVHRDLKPANVKLTATGHAKLLDFGLAKVFDELDSRTPPSEAEGTSRATITGILLGTPSYMSPEQARGEPVGRRTDVWSFGCTFFEALTGRSPFSGETLSDTFAAVLNREPDWTALPKETSSPIRKLLRSCLEKNPLDRPESFAEIRTRLAPAHADAGARRATQKRLGGLVVLGVLVLGPAWILLNDRRPSEAVTQPAAPTVSTAPGTRPALFAYVTTSEPSAVEIIDIAARKLVSTVEVPGETFRDRLGGIAVSPDGASAYMTGVDQGRVFAVDTRDARTKRLPPASVVSGFPLLNPRELALTPDGSRLYVTSYLGEVRVLETVATGAGDRRISAVSDGRGIQVGTWPCGIAISPEGTRAYVANFRSDSISVIDIDPSSPTFHTVLPVSGGNAIRVEHGPCGVAIDPSGTRLYVANVRSHVVSIVDTTLNSRSYGTVVATAKSQSEPWSVAVTPDGTRVYVTNRRSGSVSVIDTKTSAVLLPPVAVGTSPGAIAMTRDGRRGLVACLNSREVAVIDTDPKSATFHTVVASIGVRGRPEGIAIAAEADARASPEGNN